MRRHTVGIAHPQDEAAPAPTDAAHYFTPYHHHHHYQPAAAGPFLHPTMFAPGAAAAHGLPHVFMPQDLSVHSASEEDESLPTNCLSSAIADPHLLRPPQIAGIIVIIVIIIVIIIGFKKLIIIIIQIQTFVAHNNPGFTCFHPPTTAMVFTDY